MDKLFLRDNHEIILHRGQKTVNLENFVKNSTFQILSKVTVLETSSFPENSISFISTHKDIDKSHQRLDQDKFILLCKLIDENKICIKTGNYVGVFIYGGIKFEITSRFNNIFLQRMLSFAQDIYINENLSYAEITKKTDIFKYVIAQLFIRHLEKAYLNGLPKKYYYNHNRDKYFRGVLDINNYLRKDIPFLGQISFVSREQNFVYIIATIINKAITILSNDFSIDISNRIQRIRQDLKKYVIKTKISTLDLTIARNDKALQNNIYKKYLDVLNYAKIIIFNYNILESLNEKSLSSMGYLINIAELFEIYIIKLLNKEIHNWTTHFPSPKIELYQNTFFARKIIPDIVMVKNNDTLKVVVFDTKYKSMNFIGRTQFGMGDVDRSDFFQIHTYMSYYKEKSGYDLIAGGLIYPIIGNLYNRKDDDHCSNYLGDNSKVKFIIDGIVLTEYLEDNNINNINNVDGIIREEKNFINRINAYLKLN